MALALPLRAMKRIVTSTYRYKRPPRRKKAVALAVPQIVAIPRKQGRKSQRRPETSVKPLFTSGGTGSAAGQDPKCRPFVLSAPG
jgi:hypothetical protein